MVTKRLFLILGLLFTSFPSAIAQEKCDAWDAYGNYLEEKITRIFTSERHTDYRERTMPSELKSVSVSDIRRLNLPNDQSICDDILENMYGDEPVPGPPKYRAIWKIKDNYLLVIFSLDYD